MNGSSGIWIFLAVAAVIVLVFCASLYWVGKGGNGSRAQAVALAVFALLATGGMYGALGEPAALDPAQVTPQAQSPHGSMPGMPTAAEIAARVDRLADRLKEHPEDLDGWLMLARSYTMLGRNADADAAYEHARERVMQDSDLLLGWIDLRLRLNGEKFDARTYELADRALTLAPDDSNVMLVSAIADYSRGDKDKALALVNKLRERYPQNAPERKDLDGVVEQWMPSLGAASAKQ